MEPESPKELTIESHRAYTADGIYWIVELDGVDVTSICKFAGASTDQTLGVVDLLIPADQTAERIQTGDRWHRRTGQVVFRARPNST